MMHAHRRCREARQNLSELLEEVKKGREIVITDRGRPVARLAPVERRRPFPDLSRVRAAFRGPDPAVVTSSSRRTGRSPVSGAAPEHWVEPVYLDASALVKLFVPERESDDLNQALAGLTDVIVSDPALTELASAVGRRTREQRLTRAEAQRLYREASKLHASSHRAELTPPIHRRAERLMLSFTIPLRALDALHLATALERGSGDHRHVRSAPARRRGHARSFGCAA